MPHSLSYYEDLIPSISFLKGIPKVLVQTSKSFDVPERIACNISHLKQTNPAWDYLFFDDQLVEDFILKEYGSTVFNEYYKRIDKQYGAAKADFFRYLYLYRYGGVYIDIKSSLTKPLDDFLFPDDCFVTGHWDSENELHKGWGRHYKELSHIEGGEYLQCCIMSSQGHPFLRAVIVSMLRQIDSYCLWRDRVGHDPVFFTTGPNMYSIALHREMGLLIEPSLYRIVNLFDDLGYVYDIYEKDANDAEAHAKIFKSHYRNSWHPLIIHKNKLIQVVHLMCCWLYSKYLGQIAKRR